MSTYIVHSEAWDVGDILAAAEARKEHTVTGVSLGDYVEVSASLDVLDLELTAHVTAADKVTVTFANLTGGTIDALTPTIRLRITTLSGLHIS